MAFSNVLYLQPLAAISLYLLISTKHPKLQSISDLDIILLEEWYYSLQRKILFFPDTFKWCSRIISRYRLKKNTNFFLFFCTYSYLCNVFRKGHNILLLHFPVRTATSSKEITSNPIIKGVCAYSADLLHRLLRLSQACTGSGLVCAFFIRKSWCWLNEWKR